MTPRQKKRFRKQFAEQVEQERNGAPPPPEFAARMTKPKLKDQLHQVVVTRREGGLIAVGPAMIKDAAGMFCEAINTQIVKGAERTWTSATVVPLTPIT